MTSIYLIFGKDNYFFDNPTPNTANSDNSEKKATNKPTC